MKSKVLIRTVSFILSHIISLISVTKIKMTLMPGLRAFRPMGEIQTNAQGSNWIAWTAQAILIRTKIKAENHSMISLKVIRKVLCKEAQINHNQDLQNKNPFIRLLLIRKISLISKSFKRGQPKSGIQKKDTKIIPSQINKWVNFIVRILVWIVLERV